jgi:prophage antirepressor-like protein
MMQFKRFEFGDRGVRVLYGEGVPQFVVSDVLPILRLGEEVMAPVGVEHRSMALLETGPEETIDYVGLESLIPQSRCHGVKSFHAWLLDVVLPWIARDMTLAQADFIEKITAEEEKAAHDAHIALNLAAPVLQRKKLMMDFSDLHHPKAAWVTEGALLLVDTEEAGWAEKLLQKLSREQLGEVIQTAARKLSSRSG